MRTFVDPGATFVPSCERHFGFLERDFGCSARVIATGAALVYTNRTTGVRIELEPRDDEICVWLIRLVDGRVPPLFAYAPSHWVPLDQLEPSLRVARRMFGEPFTSDYLERTFGAAAVALRRHGQDVLRGDRTIFEEHAR